MVGHFGAIVIEAMLVYMAQTPEKIIPFSEFIRSVKRADPNEFLGRPAVGVKDAAAFEQMRTYILKLYEGVHVLRSYQVSTQTVDCVPEREQPSMRGEHGKTAAPPPATPLVDRKKGAATGGCAPGSVPMRRITFEELTRFRSLDDFLHKAPHGRMPMPPPQNRP
ncbi:MAG: hypothetical protein ACJ746_18680 [Bryobacteraceae bacterium]